jgi:hypothetical protein
MHVALIFMNMVDFPDILKFMFGLLREIMTSKCPSRDVI